MKKQDDEIICIYTSYDATEADMIKTQLESESIPCFLKSDNAGGMLPYLNMISGFGIMVRKEDETRAKEVINERLENER